jgi:hypothetical protein
VYCCVHRYALVEGEEYNVVSPSKPGKDLTIMIPNLGPIEYHGLRDLNRVCIPFFFGCEEVDEFTIASLHIRF